MADQHDYDGIRYREDDRPPRIFWILLFGLALWAVGFMAYYLTSGWSSQGEFARKKEARDAMLAKSAVRATHPEGKTVDYVAAGKALFASHCAVCHGANAKGNIGPDLTAKTFRFGRDPASVTTTITKGRPGGMPAFGNQLNHEQIEALVHFIESLR